MIARSSEGCVLVAEKPVYSFTTPLNICLARRAGKGKVQVQVQVKFAPELRHNAMKTHGEMKV